MEKTNSFVKLSKRQQLERIKIFTKTELNNQNNKNKSVNVVLKKPTTTSGSPSIIRIVPNITKANKIEKTPSVQVRIIETPKNDKLPNSTSNSNVELRDHTYLSKEEIKTDTNDNDSLLFEDTPQIENSTSYSIHTNVQSPVSEPTSSIRLKSEISNVCENSKESHSEQCCCACRTTLNLILKQQQEILNYLKDGCQIKNEIKYDLLPPMPFNDLNDFLDFDESLCNENVQGQFTSKLKKLLVSSEQKSVSNVMSSILTNELSKEISWIGIKDTLPFGNTNMVGFIIELIQDHHQADIDVIKSRIAEWLRRCGDRISNEMKKIERKAKRFAT